MPAAASHDDLFSPSGVDSPPHPIDLSIAYQAPARKISRILLCASGTTDSGYDSLAVISADHQERLGLPEAGIHIFINGHGQLEWGRGLEKPPVFPADAREDDLVILVHGLENSMNLRVLATLRALLPVINAVHGNDLRFSGLMRHHARLGIGRDGGLIGPACQETPPELA